MYQREKIIITSGSFDPLSKEEIKFLKKCKNKGDWLVVGIHSDTFVHWTLGGVVQDYESRREIVESLKFVDEVFYFDDSDGTVCQLLKLVKICYPNAAYTFISHEDMHNMPEMKIKGINFEIVKIGD
jgi:cytidyltransferase-like protein